jgi:hypothetical protein
MINELNTQEDDYCFLLIAQSSLLRRVRRTPSENAYGTMSIGLGLCEGQRSNLKCSTIQARKEIASSSNPQIRLISSQ